MFQDCRNEDEVQELYHKLAKALNIDAEENMYFRVLLNKSFALAMLKVLDIEFEDLTIPQFLTELGLHCDNAIKMTLDKANQK